MATNKVTTATIRQKKINAEPIAMLTVYDAAFARLFDEAGIDMLLVGDSVGNTVLGYESTVPVTMEDMLHHARAVCRGTSHALVVVDLPFMSYQISVEEAMRNAGRILKETAAVAVKLEGGKEIAPAVKAMTSAGIPVVGHLGLTPQSVNQLGGFKVQGKDMAAAQALIDNARVIEEAGAFSLVLECIPAQLAAKVTQALSIPTIGIGGGSSCDGQVLVMHDLLGLLPGFKPKFAKTYRNLHTEVTAAVREYIDDVKSRRFPGAEHSFTIADDVLEKLY